MRLKRISRASWLSLVIFIISCSGKQAKHQKTAAHSASAGSIRLEERQAIKRVVENFGNRLKMVSLQAPDSIRLAQIRQEYKEFITPDLLQKWIQSSDSAPGREVSSPWPERIKVQEIIRIKREQIKIKGDIIYLTSVEMAQGGVAAQKSVALLLDKKEGDHWLINAYKQSSGWKDK